MAVAQVGRHAIIETVTHEKTPEKPNMAKTERGFMTEEELREIEERCEKATPGPWKAFDSIRTPEHWKGPNGVELEKGHSAEAAVVKGDDGHEANICTLHACTGVFLQRCYDERPQMLADVSFLAAARTDVPALLAEVRRLQVALAKTSDRADYLKDMLSRSRRL